VKPVRTAWTEMVYRGPSADVGDLWCHRVRPGEIMSVWEPTDQERALLADGGRVVLSLLSEPIPPIAIWVQSDEHTAPVAEHGYKVIPELSDPERKR
jgi:hypothetical protein